MSNNFKKGIDRQMWVQVAPAPNAHAAGSSMCSDLRNDLSRNPFIYHLVSAAILNKYNFVTKGWILAVNPGLGGTFGAGATCVFAPSFSLIGAIGAGCTTTSIVTTTSMTAVGVNMLASRGGSGEYGFRVRIIDNAGGASGKIEERWIIANTGGTTPTLTLESALSFTPATASTYEILGGKVFMWSAGTLAATIFRSFEIAANTLTSLTNTNLPASITLDSSAVALDEQYVPYDHIPGEGFVVGASTYDGGTKRCLLATGSGAASITGQTSGGDNVVIANEYRNFQIRIVEDTAKPTAVNQRAIIASHTAGSAGVAPVYTLGANWATITPSTDAKFVIEYPNQILLWSSGTAVTYTYNYTNATQNNGTASIAAGAWHVTYFGNRGGNMGVGCTSIQSFGIEPDVANNSKHSHIHSFRGAVGLLLDILDIAGGVAGTWENSAVYDGNTKTFLSGSNGVYAPFDNEGRFGYINNYLASLVNQMFRYDVQNRVMQVFTPTDFLESGSGSVGCRTGVCCAIDGEDKYSILFHTAHLSTLSQELIIQV